MRQARWLVPGLIALAACGDDREGPTACEVGPEIVHDAIASLLGSQPPCAQDDDCVALNLDVDCRGYQQSGCVQIVHRASAGAWSEAAVCKRIDDVAAPSKYECAMQGSCAAAGAPVCLAGVCTGSLTR
ncbi:MAG: hypothetical protein JWN48_926 [Myxococcaceae bacterium]|nr:hypothetical protein [Myxococcaceae bacterium]